MASPTTSEPRPAPRKRLLIGLALLVGTSAAGLAAAEGALRWLDADAARARVAELTARKQQADRLLGGNISSTVQQVYRDHPYYGYTMKPRLAGAPMGWRLETDRYGFRNARDFDYRAEPDATIVVGLFGGSCAFGWEIDGNEATLASQLETLLNAGASPPARYRVVNFGIPGWHHPQPFLLISRIIEDLDAIIAFDGPGEFFIPVWNTFGIPLPLPPDYPWGNLYVPAVVLRSPIQNLSMYALLSYESEYDPAGLAARFQLYNWARHREATRRRSETLRVVQTASILEPDRFEESPFSADLDRYDDVVARGVADHAKYSRMVDLVAGEHGVPVLHVIHPFLYASASVEIEEKHLPPYARLIVAKGHPSRHYARLREGLARMAGAAKPEERVRFLDLAEAVPPGEENWIDLFHPTERGYGIAAERIRDFLASSGLLGGLR
jgi:hypothetical protein